MGRVKRYRKLKAHDPFYRGPRRDRGGIVNLCPENEDDQPVPKSLMRLMKRVEEMKKTVKKKKKKRRGSLSHTAGQGSAEPALSEQHNRANKQKEEEPMFLKREGESLRNYLERVDMEANARIMETFRKNRKPSDTRKMKLEERRRKLVARRKGLNKDLEFENLRDNVKFGEVVQAPPQLMAQPRGTQPTSHSHSKPLLLQQKLPTLQKPTKTKSSHKSGVLGLKRVQDLELEREHVISVYRQKKRALIRKL